MAYFKRIIGILSIALILMLIGNKAMFWHTHHLSDGSVIQHAHPYSKSQESQSGTQHQHNNFEFLLFQQLLILSLIAFFVFSIQRKKIYSLVSKITENKKFDHLIYLSRLRGPPELN